MSKVKALIEKYKKADKGGLDPEVEPAELGQSSIMKKAREVGNAVLDDVGELASEGLQKLGVPEEYAKQVGPAARMTSGVLTRSPWTGTTASNIIQKAGPLKPSQTVENISKRAGVGNQLSEKARQLTQEEKGNFGKVYFADQGIEGFGKKVKPVKDMPKINEYGVNLTELEKELVEKGKGLLGRMDTPMKEKIVHRLAQKQLEKKK